MLERMAVAYPAARSSADQSTTRLLIRVHPSESSSSILAMSQAVEQVQPGELLPLEPA
jgi:hypothetical protein